MIKNKIIIFVGILFVCSGYAADTPDYIGMQLDAQIAELTSRRDKLRADLESCEKNTRGFKIAGISTLTATGIGVVGNIKLAKDIEEQKLLKGKGGGSAAGGRGGGAGGPKQDTRSEEEKANSDCEMFCESMPDQAIGIGCEC